MAQNCALIRLRYSVRFSRDFREATPSLDGAKAPGVNIFVDDDFGGMDMGGGDDDDGL